MIFQSRLELIKRILNLSPTDCAIFATTGETAREVLKVGVTGRKYFPCVGGMGHASSVAFGYALFGKSQTICFDGDGALLMHLGGLSSVTSSADVRFLHVLFDNGCHLSVGGNKTSGNHLSYVDIAKSLKYNKVIELTSLDQLGEILGKLESDNPSIQFIYIRVQPFKERELPRPTSLSSFVENFRRNW